MTRPSAAIALVLIVLAVPAEAAAADGPARTAAWRALARDMAAPWPGLQEPNGRLPDYLDERYGTQYGDAIMGYGLIRVGIREDDRRMVRAGLRAVTYSVTRPVLARSSFEVYGIAAAYNLARARVARYDDFRKNRTRWERWLRRARTTRLHLRGGHFGNHWLIDALAVIEARRTGLRSGLPETILGGARGSSWRQALRLINGRVPDRVGRSGTMLLSDPPDHPLAYHGLSIGFYAHAIHLLGRRAGRRSRTTLRRMVRAAWLATAPDGDTSYWGRSLQYVWSPAGTGYGAEAAAALPGVPEAERRVHHALAERTFARVAREHPIGPRGQWIVPALAQDFRKVRRRLEGYAGAPSMSGLALLMLNWTLDEPRRTGPSSRIPADRGYAAALSRSTARFAVARRGRVWFAVKLAHAERSYKRSDLRYAFGLLTAKLRGPEGWFDLVPQRPPLGGRSPVTAGPVLTRPGPGHPTGIRLRTGSRGRITVHGAYRTRGGRTVRRVSWRFVPVDCGVMLSFRARRGERYAFTAFFRRGRPRVSGKHVSDGEQRVTVTPSPSSVSIAPRTVASALDAHLHRVRVRLAIRRPREVRISFCRDGAAAPPPTEPPPEQPPYADPLP